MVQPLLFLFISFCNIVWPSSYSLPKFTLPVTTKVILLKYTLCMVIPYSREEWLKPMFTYIFQHVLGSSSIAVSMFASWGCKEQSPVSKSSKPPQKRSKVAIYSRVVWAVLMQRKARGHWRPDRGIQLKQHLKGSVKTPKRKSWCVHWDFKDKVANIHDFSHMALISCFS